LRVLRAMLSASLEGRKNKNNENWSRLRSVGRVLNG